MKKLLLRMLREIRQHLGQFISIVMIIAIGSAMFSGMLGAILSINKGVDDFYKNQRLADLWVMVQGVTKAQVIDLEEENNLEAEGRYTLNLEALVHGEEVSLRAHSLTTMNTVFLKEGSLPVRQNECVVDSKFARANGLGVGDSIGSVAAAGNSSTETGAGSINLWITGIGDSPEYAYKVKDGTSTMVSQKTFGIIYSTEDTLTELIKSSSTYQDKIKEINAKLGEGPKAEAARKDLDESMLGYQEILIRTENSASAKAVIEQQDYTIAVTQRVDQVSYNMVQGGIDTISTVSYIFPIVFFVVAALILLISMSKMVENQRMQIAVMEAIGISKSKIRCAFMFYAAAASILGSIMFSYLGNKLISHVIILMFKNRFCIDEIRIVSNPLLLLAPFVLALTLSTAAAVIAVSGVLKLVPAQAMRPKPPKKSKTILIEKATWLWKRLSYRTKLIFRNLFLNKTRVILSSIGIISSVMLMLTGLSLQNAATDLLKSKKDSIGYDLSVVYQDGIKDAENLSFPVDVNKIELTKNLKATLPDMDSLGISVQILPEECSLVRLFDLKEDLLTVEHDSVIIPHTLAKDYDIAVGDVLKLVIDDETLAFTVTGISAQYTGSIIYLADSAAADAGLDYSYNTAMLQLTDSNNSAVLQESLLHDDSIKSVNSKVDITGAAADNLKLLNAIIVIIIAASVIMSVAVIYNITSINLFERAREFATLMVLGYYKNEVGKLLFTENSVIAVLGCIGGLPCGMILFKVILGSFANSGVTLPENISLTSVVIAFGITLTFSVITNLIMKKKVSEIDMIEALKGVE